MCISLMLFFCNDSATTEIYTLSLHDALPIYFNAHRLLRAIDHNTLLSKLPVSGQAQPNETMHTEEDLNFIYRRSAEHTSELQSQSILVCRLLLEKNNEALTVVSEQTDTLHQH